MKKRLHYIGQILRYIKTKRMAQYKLLLPYILVSFFWLYLSSSLIMKVCKHFLCGFCPCQLFVNTRSDLGEYKYSSRISFQCMLLGRNRELNCRDTVSTQGSAMMAKYKLRRPLYSFHHFNFAVALYPLLPLCAKKY